MNNRYLLLAAFAIVALVQLYIPAKMILDNEDILGTGTEYKFRTAPLDPTDPFRGKYIILSYDENIVEIHNENDWNTGESIYVLLTTDDQGFAKIKSISKEQPTESEAFLKARVGYVSGDGSNKLSVDYPFDRFYMEESKAYDAELTYRRSQRDTSQTTYALVSVKQGNSVLKDVLIDGISIREIVKSNQAQQ